MRNPKKVIYASSADRGLDVLLSIWPEVKKAVPDAELVWAYGWNTFDSFHSGNQEMMKWKWDVIRAMHKVGCKALGRLSHEELAKEFLSSGIWAYPTSFMEIDCITATKAQMAGCEPVTSGKAALQTSVLKDEEEVLDIHENPKELAKFTQRLIKALKNPLSEKERDKYREFAAQREWSNIAAQWGDAVR